MTSLWTVRKLISWTIPWFEEHGIASPRLDAELLLSNALHCPRLDLYLNPDKPVTEAERSRYKALIKRRAAREPIAYILGEKEFWKRSFKVDSRVLIPRPETETLIETALKLIPHDSETVIADLGTGSGCIGITLAAELPLARVIATDTSSDALAVARENSLHFNVSDRLIFSKGDWFEALHPVIDPRSFDLIVSNPPYISQDSLAELQPEILRYEPAIALNGGKAGLNPYFKITAGAKQWLKPGGFLILEIGHTQGDQLRKCLANSDFFSIEIVKDLAGCDRVILGTNAR